MPGVNLNLVLPTLADNMSTIVSKIVTALSAIQTDLAGKIVPAQMNINQALPMNGAALTNTGSVQFGTGNAPTSAGSLYYNLGELYFIDAAGTVRITNNGSLDLTASGTIGGDYGGNNPASVTYNTAAGEYRFMINATTWANLVAAGLVLKGTNGSVTLSCNAAITTARQISIMSLPTSGVSALVYNSATSTLEDAAVTRATNVTKVTDIDSAGIVTCAGVNVGSLGKYKHGTRFQVVPITSAGAFATTGSLSTYGGIGNSVPGLTVTANSIVMIPLPGLREDETLVGVTVRLSNLVGFTHNVSYTLYTSNAGSGFQVVTGATATNTSTTVSLTPTTPQAYNDSSQCLWLQVLTNQDGVVLVTAEIASDVR